MVKRLQRKNRHYALVGALVCAVVLSLGNFDNPPNGFTGAPGESLCTECHSLGTATQNGSIIFSGFPSTINANQTYILTITVVNPNGVADYAGFQTVILDSNNENAGTLTNASAGSTITPAGNRVYHEHNPAQMFGMPNAVAWTVDWTAPVGSGPITYYSAANIANGNNSTTGDLIVTKTGTGTLFTPLQVVITDVTDVSCIDGMDGSVSAQASFGDPGYTYQWSNGGSEQQIVGLSTGFYNVTVTDSEGATATASAEVEEPELFEIVSESIDHVSCNGGSDGLIILELNGGTPPYTGAQGEFITYANLEAGEFPVMITDANGCLISEEYFINEPPPLNIEITVIIEPECFGESTGFVSIEASGGMGDIEYAWSNGATTNSIQNLEEGVYAVTVTDENDCTAAETIILDEPELILLDLVLIEHVSCAGGEDGTLIVDASGGTGDLSFVWSNGLTSASLSGLAAGNYSVTVSDENGCTEVENYLVTEPVMLSVSFAGMMNLLCFDDTTGSLQVLANGGTPAYTFLWSDGSTNSERTGLLAGIYPVTVTDVNGCSIVSIAEITEPSPLLPNVTSTGESAIGAMDGTATANPTGGTGDYTFLWSTGDITAMISGLSAGVYNVTVTDENDCTAMQSVAVTGTNCSMLVSTTTTAALCFGEASGTAQLNVIGAMGAVEILWSTGDTTMFVENLLAGMYSAEVEDEAGCVAVVDVLIDEPEMITSVCSVTGETMEGANDGSITCLITGGTMPYQFLWSNGDTTENINGLSPGLYVLTITDGNGCILTDSAFVNAFTCVLQLNVSVEAPLCFGENTGSASAQVFGGVEPYQFIWSNGDVTSVIDSLLAGVYSVTITDAESCVAEQVFEIDQPDQIAVVVDTVIDATQSGGGAIQITITGGTAPYTTIWTKNGGLVSTEEDPVDLSAGDYELLILDANDCMLDAVEVTVMFSSGVDDITDNLALTLWPNPATDFILLSIKGANMTLHGTLYSSEGQHISKFVLKENEEKRFDLRDLAIGLYYIQITDGRKGRVMVFVKM